jgi:hypothetical protein
MGKGSKMRPRSVSYDEYQKRWDLIFNKKKTDTKNKKPEIQQEKNT